MLRLFPDPVLKRLLSLIVNKVTLLTATGEKRQKNHLPCLICRDEKRDTTNTANNEEHDILDLHITVLITFTVKICSFFPI